MKLLTIWLENFLKDNEITCEVREGTVHSALVKEINREDSEFLRLVKGQ